MKFERQLEYDKTYLKMAKVLSQLSYANRNKVGALIVSEKGQIIAQGWNGTPSGMDNCCEEVKCDCNWIHGCRKNSKPIEKVLSVEHCKDCNHASLTTKQEVLHADWHELAHSLHPGFFKLFLMLVLLIVFICFIYIPPKG